MIHTLAEWLFSGVCHQQAARAWVPGGVALTLCQRCTGVYVGAALFLCLLPLMHFRPSRRLAAIHAAFILQMALFGTHLVPHPAWTRTLSGQLFITGAGYFVWTNLRFQKVRQYPDRSPRTYLLALLGTLTALQLLVHAPFAAIATLLELLAVLGVVVILVETTTTLGDLVLRATRWKRHEAQA